MAEAKPSKKRTASLVLQEGSRTKKLRSEILTEMSRDEQGGRFIQPERLVEKPLKDILRDTKAEIKSICTYGLVRLRILRGMPPYNGNRGITKAIEAYIKIKRGGEILQKALPVNRKYSYRAARQEYAAFLEERGQEWCVHGQKFFQGCLKCMTEEEELEELWQNDLSEARIFDGEV